MHFKQKSTSGLSHQQQALRTQFFTIFHKTAYGSEMRSARCLFFLRQTGSKLPILEVCKMPIFQFRHCGRHIFSRIVTKTPTEA